MAQRAGKVVVYIENSFDVPVGEIVEATEQQFKTVYVGLPITYEVIAEPVTIFQGEILDVGRRAIREAFSRAQKIKGATKKETYCVYITSPILTDPICRVLVFAMATKKDVVIISLTAEKDAPDEVQKKLNEVMRTIQHEKPMISSVSRKKNEQAAIQLMSLIWQGIATAYTKKPTTH